MKSSLSGESLGWLRAAPLLLGLLIAAAYAPVGDAEFVVWDDDDHIYENRHIIAEDGYLEAWRDWRDPAFYPITFTSWYIEWRVGDGTPWLFHVDNVLLHFASAILLALLLRVLGLRHGLAWAIAGIWALHPQQVASVAWATERKNLLYGGFYLASLLAYAHAVGAPRGASTRRWLLAIALAIASLLSKASAVTLPLLIMVVHGLRGGTFDRRSLGRLGVFFALAIATGLLHISREQVTPLLPLDTRLLVAGSAGWFYVGKFLWPTGLVAVYPQWPVTHIEFWGIASWLGIAVVFAAAAALARRIPPTAWFGGAMYIFNVALIVGVIWFPFMGYSFVSDHLVYLPTVGLAVLFGLVADALLSLARTPAALRNAACGLLWLGLAVLSWQQTGHWKNSETLWTQTLEENPQSRLAHKNLGFHLIETNRPERAREHFLAVLELAPNDSEALLNLGVLASDRGDWKEANVFFERTLAQGAYPARVLNNLGVSQAKMGNFEKAVPFYERSLEIDPRDASVWMNLGSAQMEVGRPAEAIRNYGKALRMNPRSARAHFNLGHALRRVGRFEEAVRAYERAHRLDPTDVDTSTNLGVLLLEIDQPQRALEMFEAALEEDPNRSESVHNKGAALLALQRLTAAEAAFRRAHEIDPSDIDTGRILLALLLRRGAEDRAVEVLMQTLRHHPDDPRLNNQLGWVRATSLNAHQKNPTEAIELARRAIEHSRGEAFYLDTLAAAYAAAGRFADARLTAEQSLERAPAENALASERQRRLDLYTANRPFERPRPPGEKPN